MKPLPTFIVTCRPGRGRASVTAVNIKTTTYFNQSTRASFQCRDIFCFQFLHIIISQINEKKILIFSVHPAACSELAWETQPAAKAENEYSRFLSESLSCHPAAVLGWTQAWLTINELLIVFRPCSSIVSQSAVWVTFYSSFLCSQLL